MYENSTPNRVLQKGVIEMKAVTHRWRQWLSIGVLSAVLGACGKDVFVPLRFKTEEFKQNAAAKIDVLWVVDNSSSMAEEQASLGRSFQIFIDNLINSGVDYHIAVTSTDASDQGKLHKGGTNPAVIDPQISNPQATFLQNVTVGISGAREEKAFEAAAAALGKGMNWRPGEVAEFPPENSDFVRDDAALFIIMVSDEDDSSFGPVDYYRRLFKSYKGPGNESQISVSAIVGDVGAQEGCSGEGGEAQPGFRYVELAGLTGGIWTSICSDFNESLAQLSISAAGLRSTFRLSQTPDLGALLPCGNLGQKAMCVRVNGQIIQEGSDRNTWAYSSDMNAIVFGADVLPVAQSTIQVDYQEVP